MLVRWNPYREMNHMRRMMDRVYDENLAQRWNEAERSASPLALDVKESDEAYLVKATLPGIDPQDVEITYNNKTLTIQGELKNEEEHENERYHMRERYSGKFYRQLRLPFPINEEAIEAKYENGILTLTLPKSEELKPKKIVVQAV
ncbi:MAG TPA: Hsp20/alpha crystallin family protein [Anaerolineales bacterium]|nr:Hsp20/alpha crystallin family protein [Anaerolineales bacterium]